MLTFENFVQWRAKKGYKKIKKLRDFLINFKQKLEINYTRCFRVNYLKL